MKVIWLTFVIAGTLSTGCSVFHHTHSPAAKPDPESVLITYRVQSGKEAEFEAVLAQAWRIYRKENLVKSSPHLVYKRVVSVDKTEYVELFTWRSHAGPENAPESVKAIWEQEQALCEARGGHRGIEGGEVESVSPK
jgi:hypothetical protein